jgi:hypothetical protein
MNSPDSYRLAPVSERSERPGDILIVARQCTFGDTPRPSHIRRRRTR